MLGAAARVNALDELDLAGVHAMHADFVWLTLQQFGVPPADLDDALQEVFVVVQRKLGSFDGSSALRTWLFGICRRVAAAFRRRAHVRREHLVGVVPEEMADPGLDPEEAAAVREADALLRRVLDRMNLDRRVAFVMFEIDGLPCDEIAALTGVAVGTVYARLHDARKEFAEVLRRVRAADARRGAR